MTRQRPCSDFHENVANDRRKINTYLTWAKQYADHHQKKKRRRRRKSKKALIYASTQSINNKYFLVEIKYSLLLLAFELYFLSYFAEHFTNDRIELGKK